MDERGIITSNGREGKSARIEGMSIDEEIRWLVTLVTIQICYSAYLDCYLKKILEVLEELGEKK
jgi:hypothetical protein